MGNELTDAQTEHAAQVRAMFAGIASRYDLLNHLLSVNTDKRWRRLVARKLAEDLRGQNRRALDVACGTGDLALTLAEMTDAEVTGLDFCRRMLTHAASKTAATKFPIPYIEGDALNLPFPAETFDAVTIAFGLRNLADVEAGLRELLRILKPNGRAAILEFSQPVVPGFRQVFNFYFANILPRIGGAVSGSRGAYEYLPDSVARFPAQKELKAMLERVGFREVTYQNLTGGIAALHLGRK